MRGGFGDEGLEALRLLEAARPPALRRYDQIPMLGSDLLEQVLRVAPDLAGRSVAFVGDYDGTSLLLGLLHARGLLAGPARMLLLDFDERLLIAARKFAALHGFGGLLDTRLYNVFRAVPAGLAGGYEVFYTNPPYGGSNNGASARLFITRGCELAVPGGGRGYLLLPDTPRFPWSQRAMSSTRRFLRSHGWRVVRAERDLHRYHLDDAPALSSSLTVIERDPRRPGAPAPPWAGRDVQPADLPRFYGRGVSPPYPESIGPDGQPRYPLGTVTDDEAA
ncbi:bis-aminopropyl spermidine synthase family protein [Calidithermus chliarophilus]|uniref:bis-aminopropyl spermidine synthase family protein n=1 Tax=Calidithermus chliarophilus TaxID=52023 RepID=UPI00041E33AA|nr:bis-aminopropyl spermidine synthase family protein [Calidithermus chliarophilus]